jgi:mannobiose 2-epimerase
VHVTAVGKRCQRLAQDVHAYLDRGRAPRGIDAGVPPDARLLDAARRRVERMLAEDVLPFWTRHTWDEPHGGFITHLDRAGRPLGPTHKGLVGQARLVWTLAAAHRHGLVDRGYLDLAERGVRFLTERMWDERHGGFVLRVRRDGHVLDARKDVTAHAYVLHALGECAAATGDPSVLRWAERIFDLLERRASDGVLGYASWFERDWSPPADRSLTGKRVGTHMHLMAAFGTLLECSARPPVRAALARVVDLLLGHAIDPRRGSVVEGFDHAWRARTSGGGPRIASYGHGAELAWLVLDALDRLARPRRTHEPRLLGLVDHALDHGFDWRRGGVALYGPPAGRVTRAIYLSPRRLRKVWWPQAELLVALAEAYGRSRAPRYWRALERQLDWIEHRQADPLGGDWFESVSWRGRPLTLVKGHDSKEPYHHGRALMRTARVLGALAAAEADASR